MALNTGNPYLDAIGGTPWGKNSSNTAPDGGRILGVWFDNLTSHGHSTGGAWTLGEQSALWDALLAWSSVANIHFVSATNAITADLIERKVTDVELPDDVGKSNFPDQPNHVTRFNVTDPNAYWTPAGLQPGGYAFETLVHEIGHSIGLAHPHDLGDGTGLFPGVDPVNADGSGDPTDLGDNQLNSIPYTIMSYNEGPGSSTARAIDRGFAETPLAFDIAAVQLMYGAVAHNSGDTVYTLRDDAPGNAWICIWDTGGNDTIRYDGARDATIDLRAATLKDAPGGGGFISSVDGALGGYTIAADVTDFDHDGNFGVVIENAVGGSGKDTLIGNAANNRLEGRDGNDTLDGGAGADVMIGGVGNDSYVVDTAGYRMVMGTGIFAHYVYVPGDQVIENPDEGYDAVFASIDYTLPSNVEALTLTGTSNLNGFGNDLDNTITGNNGANRLEGYAGNDILDGGKGADVMIGGLGDDTYHVDTTGFYGFSGGHLQFFPGDQVIENPGEGTDTVDASVSYTLPANVEILKLDEIAGDIDGFGNDLANTLYGNSGVNRLEGYGGDDTLDGGAGADVMIGGVGDDTYYVDTTAFYAPVGGHLQFFPGDQVIENPDEGKDTVIASVSYTLPDNVEVLFLKEGVGDIDGAGNELANEIYGNSGANRLYGYGGDDTLSGGGGGDVLIGGTGNDTYWVLSEGHYGRVGSHLQFFPGDQVIENPDEGHDTIYSALTSYTLPDNVEDLYFVDSLAGGLDLDGWGNDEDNHLTGNSGANRLEGLGGDDVIDGGDGADVAVFRGARSDYAITLLVDSRIQVVDSVAGRDGTDLLSNIEKLQFSDGYVTSSSITGFVADPGNQPFVGDAGPNDIQGTPGADVMIGGLGDDIYHVDSEADVVMENPDEGSDTIYSTVNYTMPANVETLVLMEDAPAAINGAGNDDLNWIYGNSLDNALSGYGGDDILLGGAGNDILDGGIGNDVMVGGLGDDTYYVDSEADTIVESPNEGHDTVFASINYTLSDNFETLFLVEGAPGAINGAGNDVQNFIYGNSLDNALSGYAGDDVLVGGAGNDILDGGIGTDVMAGGLGDDTYYVDSEADTIFENPNEGTDTVFASINYTLADNFEILFLQEGAPAAINGAGNGDDNRIYGNALDNALSGYGGNDILVGGAGNDRMDGGPGADILAGGPGKDTFVFHAGEANGDAIIDFSGAGGDGDTLRFVGYGTEAQGANLTRLDATHWSINSADGTVHDVIQLTNGAAIHAADHAFI